MKTVHKYGAYSRIGSRMEAWERIRLFYERGMIKRPRAFYLLETFNPSKYILPMQEASRRKQPPSLDQRLLEAVYRKYPDTQFYPFPSKLLENDVLTESNSYLDNPIVVFIQKQKKYMKKGFTQEKAFEMAEKEQGEIIERNRMNNRILRGGAMNNSARSLLSYAEQTAEFEARQKVIRLKRELPKYMRREYRGLDGIKEMDEEEEYKEGQKKDINEIFQSKFYSISPGEYSSVVYDITGESDTKYDKRTPKQLQFEFIRDSERLLELHEERAGVNDGLKGLSDQQILNQVRESPTKLKRQTKALLIKLKKLNVGLTPEGEVDYCLLNRPHLLHQLKAQEQLIKIVLMEQDLEFEYPQKLGKIEMKAMIQQEVEKELFRLENSKLKAEDTKRLKEDQIIMQKRYKGIKYEDDQLTYEEYYNNWPHHEVEEIEAENTNKKFSKPTFKEFCIEAASSRLFENDLLGISYKYFETEEEREERLRQKWLELRESISKSNDIFKRTTYEEEQLFKKITEKIRKLRWKVDQEYVQNNKQPLFMENYYTYTREEFMADYEIEFYKLKNLFDKYPDTIKEDISIGEDYTKILKVIRKVKMNENATTPFGEEQLMEYFWNLEDDKVKDTEYRGKKDEDDKMMLKDLYGKKNEDEEENIQYYDDKEESTDKSEKDLSTFSGKMTLEEERNLILDHFKSAVAPLAMKQSDKPTVYVPGRKEKKLLKLKMKQNVLSSAKKNLTDL